MICDDEVVFRNGLRLNIPWEENNMELVAEASNGAEAIENISIFRPDIIITDIMMPQVNGIELAEYIRDNNLNIKVVMLTVMDTFPEMQRALRAGVFDYILKFDYNTEALPILQKLCRVLDSEKQISTETKNENQEVTTLLRNCILGNISNVNEDEFKGLYSTVLQMKLDNINQKEEIDIYLKLQYEIKNLTIKTSSYIVDTGSKTCLVLFLPTNEEQDAMQIGRTIIRRFIRNNKEYESIAVGCGGLKSSIKDLLDSYNESDLALSMANMKNTNLLFYFNLSGDKSYYQILMQKATAFIDANFDDKNLSLASLADQFNISVSYLSTIFKQVFGMGFNEYLTRVRLNYAKTLLETTSLLNYEITEKVGYSTPQYLSIMFKRYFGCSLGDYRKNIGKGNKK